jgi:type II secretory pathway predicted ATPase ExeA
MNHRRKRAQSLPLRSSWITSGEQKRGSFRERQGVCERERFARLVEHGFKSAGCTHTLLTDSGLEILRQASKGLPRHAARILRTAMRLAVPRGLNHLPDDLLQLAIEELR